MTNSCKEVTFLLSECCEINKSIDGSSAAPCCLPSFLYVPPTHPPKLRLSSCVVLSPDAGGTLVLVFIPTWLTNRLLTVILTRTRLLSGHSALLLISAPTDLLIMNLGRSHSMKQSGVKLADAL